MNLVLDSVRLGRGNWSLTAQGRFEKGIHLVTGEVGSGKSTLALALAGLLPPESGTITSSGIVSRMLSFQFPEFHVTGSTIGEECQSWGLDPDTVLSHVNLQGKREFSPHSLSRGELKRLHLACIFAKDYELLILDEPFSSLDCREKMLACKNISSRAPGITIIFAHEQSIFPRVDFLWEIRNGSLNFVGRMPEDLFQWTRAPHFIRNLIDAGKIPRNISPDDLMEAACRT